MKTANGLLHLSFPLIFLLSVMTIFYNIEFMGKKRPGLIVGLAAFSEGVQSAALLLPAALLPSQAGFGTSLSFPRGSVLYDSTHHCYEMGNGT
jgi:hypothetical protein